MKDTESWMMRKTEINGSPAWTSSFMGFFVFERKRRNIRDYSSFHVCAHANVCVSSP